MKVFITGANGFLSTHICVELLRRGYFVRGYLRQRSKFRGDHHASLELVEGDIRNADGVRAAMEGCDYVIHAAALTGQHFPRYSDYEQVNVTGTLNVLKAAEALKIKKLAYVSTANTLGCGSMSHPGSEDLLPGPPFTRSYYVKSKIKGEELVRQWGQRVPSVVVNPTFMLGPYATADGSGKIVFMGLKKRVVFYPPGGKNFIHVADAASGIINALEKAPAGSAFLLCNENLSYKAFFKKVRTASPHHPMLIKIPCFALTMAGVAGSFLRTLGMPTSISYTNMMILCKGNYYTNQKGRHLLPESMKGTTDAIAEFFTY